MRQVGRLAAVFALFSAIIPALLLILVVVPSLVPLGVVPPAGVIYVLIAGWVACSIARSSLSFRFTPLERHVVAFWSRTLTLILVFTTVLGAVPLLVLPAIGASVGWPIVNTTAYMRATALVVLVLAGLTIWGLWRRHRASLVESAKAEEPAA